MDWHSCSAQEALAKLEVTREAGLSPDAVSARRGTYGPNKLSEKKAEGFLAKFLAQFSDFMVIILLIAAVISFVTAAVEGNGDYIDPIIILLIVIVNAVTGVVQESKAEKAIEALKKLSSPEARVLRGGREQHIPSEEVVPGDILLLDTGDFVSADARLLEAHNLKTEESALTGESLPVEKDASAVYPPKTALGDRKNLLFATSTVTAGHAVAVAVETGMRTEVGRIAHMINEEEAPETPLQRKLAQTGKTLGIAAVLICLAIFLMGLIQSIPPLEMFMISISLAVAAIPEGLPAVVTIVLAIGVRRMAVSRAIIRRLPAVETLGSASVICSDKTGTLTQNKMTVVEVAAPGERTGSLSGAGTEILSLSALCNNSVLSGPYGDWTASGDPTETALLIAAAKAGKVKAALDNLFPRVGEIPFDSKRKLMTTVHKLGGGRYRIITKGAPDVLLPLCARFKHAGEEAPLTPHARRVLEQQNEEMASRALRVLGVAYRDVDFLPRSETGMETDLIFCGLVGMIDPPRPQAKEAVRQCRGAGIKPVMITGDHIVTAKAIAKELGILKEGDRAMTGAELDAISQEELARDIFRYSVFARVSPEHKVRIVKAFQAQGAVVAMTGDGVNDAPSIKQADIGVGMGITGTDVTKNVADMVLADDNFATIVAAVGEGRRIYDNIRKAIQFLLSSNISEIVAIFTATLLGFTILEPVHILWINLITDTFPALALGMEEGERDLMKCRPRSSREGIFSGGLGGDVAYQGVLIAVVTLAAYFIGHFMEAGVWEIANSPDGMTMAFLTMSMAEIFHAFNMRSQRGSILTMKRQNLYLLGAMLFSLLLTTLVIYVPFLSGLFGFEHISAAEFAAALGLAFCVIPIVELVKLLERTISKRKEK